MRLWHIDLIPYLPKSQLLAQWRELNSIFKKQDKHILINYVYNYDKKFLMNYTNLVLLEMQNRKYKVKSFKNYVSYFEDDYDWLSFPKHYLTQLRFEEHDKEYLTICFMNLKEKHLRGQKDFSKEIYDKLCEFYAKEMMKSD